MFKRRERRLAESGPYYKQRSWQLSAGFLGIVVVVGGIVSLLSGPGGGAGTANAAATTGPLSKASPTTKDGRPGGCATDDSAGSALPKAAPKDVTWRTLGVTRVPVSASAGPTLIQGPLWWCYAHTPTGAALAAHIIPSQMSGSHWRTVTEQQVVAGQGRDMFEFQRATVANTDEQSGGTAVASYVGFTVTSYTESAASVRLLLKSAQGYAATTISLRWSGGDWKVRPDDNGTLHTPVSSVQTTTGFTLWGGLT